ncbi:MAG: WecB/TagA/CpsF family glycosyltransferase [Ruminococcaceae bacterium]|nr:WecB/TagA/CpsF family glycosyltransferase [Oscillospiraceae bacterium]
MSRIRLCGVDIDNVTKAEAVRRALEATGETTVVFTPNAVMLDKCRRDASLADLMSHASLSLPDGAGVLLMARRLKTPLRERVAGIDFGMALLKEAAARGLRVFLLGGGDGVACEAAERLKEAHPALQICGTWWGYFDRSGEENRRVLSMIRESRADIMLVCMGFPVQERWVIENLSALSRLSVIACLGGSLDVWAGRVKRAPRALSRMGLEWAWRMAREPRRLRDVGHLARFALHRE